MASYATNEFRPGLKVLVEGEPCAILESEFVKPGKGRAFTRVKLRNLKTGRVWSRTFKSGEAVAAADVIDTAMQVLYQDGSAWHFMKTDGSYEQVAVPVAVIGDQQVWLKEQDLCEMTLWDGEPITVVPANFVELEVVQTDPGVRGDTAQGGSKPALLSTGAKARVPLFINIGDLIRIDTRTGEYQGRAKTA